MSKLFLFGIGGTGARVVRSFAMMLAAGGHNLDSSLEVVPVLLDHDKGNGDLERTKNLLNCYNSINTQMYPDAGNGTVVYSDSFFVPRLTSINRIGVNQNAGAPSWHLEFGATAQAHNVNGTGMNYADFIGYPTITSNAQFNATKWLIESLYDDSPSSSADAELHLDLDKGFKGNPSIGTVVYNELKDNPDFQNFLANCVPGNGDRVFIVGSIFGGTGSSGIPVIVDEIRGSIVGSVRNVPIGVALILPYFKLLPKDPNNIQDTGAIQSAMFNAKAQAALGAYNEGGQNSFNSKVDDLYYIGDTYTDQYEYHEGENLQVNSAHVVEWIASTAVLNFLYHDNPRNDQRVQEFGIDADGNTKAIDLTQIRRPFKDTYVDNLTIFVIAMRYFREVVLGERNPIPSHASYYNTFQLSNELSKGVYAKVKEFLSNPSWGFYSWINELASHDHALKLYRLEFEKGTTNQKNILAHKDSTVTIGKNPTSDDTISGDINNITKKETNPAPKQFFKALHNASESVFKKLNK